METATASGFRHILFKEASAAEVKAVQAYLRSLAPIPSPWLVDGGKKLSSNARRGKAVFESAEADCSRCHTGPLLSDQKKYDVGTGNNTDSSGDFVTSMLVELWRTGPYLHDGSAPTMRDVLTTRNAADAHGVSSHLSNEQIDELVEFLLSQ